MTPKEKAEDLMRKMDVKHELKMIKHTLPISMYDNQIKHCAIVTADEIIKAGIHPFDLMYWQEVKKEIEKM